MKDEPRESYRPERVLLVLARVGDDFQGRAIRFSNASEYRFKSLEELGRWLRRENPEPSQSGGGAQAQLENRAQGVPSRTEGSEGRGR